MLFKNEYTKLVKVDSVLLDQIKKEYPEYTVIDTMDTYTNSWSGVSTITLLKYNTDEEYVEGIKVVVQPNKKMHTATNIINSNPNYERPTFGDGLNWENL